MAQQLVTFYLIHPAGEPAGVRSYTGPEWDWCGIRHLYKPLYSDSFDAQVAITQLERYGRKFALHTTTIPMGAPCPARGKRKGGYNDIPAGN